MLTMLALAFAAAADAPLISTEALAARTDVHIIDARTPEEYAAGHIPGAVSLPAVDLSATRNGVPSMLRPPAEIAPMLAARGLAPDQTIAVYAAMEQPSDLKDAARVFWALNYLGFASVVVVDGGYKKWTGENRPVSTEATPLADVREVTWYLEPDTDILATKADVHKEVQAGGTTLVDMRSPEEYAGLSKKDYVERAGHIHGAVNVPAADVVGGDYNTLKPAEELRALVEDAGVPQDRAVITYCNSGRDASTGYLLFRILGREVSMYDGSMAEWSRQNALQPAAER